MNGMMKLSFENMSVDLNIVNLQRESAAFDGIDSLLWLNMYTCDEACAND